MINQTAIKNFLARTLDDFSWIKECSQKELDAAIAELDPVPDFGKIVPWNHQKATFLLLNELQRFAPLIDMGGGKTLLILMMLKYLKQKKEPVKAIVFVPYITSVETWVEETAKHAPDLHCVPLLGTSKQNLARLSGEGDLFIACYQSAVAMVSRVTKAKNGKTKWKVKAEDVRKYFTGFNMLVLDEMHRCKSSLSLTYRMCRALSAQSDWVFGLTGTPFGKDIEDLWPQFHLIDFGETLGSTLGFFREVFFNPKSNYWGGTDYTFKKKMLPELKQILKHRSIRYEIDELMDMPDKRYVQRYLPLPSGSEAYAKDALRRINSALQGNAEGSYQEIESNYLKLRQLSSGFMTLKGEDNDRLHVKFDENPKLEMLEEIIGGIPLDRKAVVFHHFVYTNEIISSRLKGMGIKHARIWSGQRDPIGQLRLFKNDPECRVLVINSRSGSSSLNLQHASYIVFFEQPDSPIDRQQAERRCWRPGQLHKVLIYDLLVKGTVDVRLNQSNKAGEALLKSLLSQRSKL